jgi:Cu/Ag efflux pump CusA
MTLLGLAIALGVIVDESIIDTENLLVRLRKRGEAGGQGKTENLIIEAFNISRSKISFTTVILLLFALPIFFVIGITGSFLRPLANAYVIAVLVALGVALIVTPALSMILFSGKLPKPSEPRLMKYLKSGYKKTLDKIMRAPSFSIITASAILIISLALIPFSEVELLPDLKKLDIIVEWEGPPGTSRGEMNRISSLALEEFRAISGVNNVGSLIGRAITGDRVVGINSGELWISIDPSADYDATIAAVRDVIDGYPGFFKEVRNYQPELIDETLTSTDHDLTIRIFGFEYDVLASQAALIQQTVSGINGVEEIDVDGTIMKPQIEVEVDLVQAERYQIKPGDVRRSSTTLISGLNVGNLYEEQKVFDVVVWGVPEIRENLNDIGNLLIDTPRGGHVLLSEVADIRIVPAPTIIKRDAVSRYTDLLVTVNGRSNGAVANDIESALDQIEFPFEYHAEVLGDYTIQQTNIQRIILISLFSLGGIFLMLQAAYNSWRLASITLAVLPFALTGGVIGAMLAGGQFYIGSIFGFITVMAIAVRTGVLIIRNLDHTEGISTGATEVLRPVLMTTLATGLAFLPFIFAGAIPGTELIYPMATVVIGGMVTVTLFNLFILPILYLRFGTDNSSLSDPTQPATTVESN